MDRVLEKLMTAKCEKPLPQEIVEARRHPGGWVYRIAGQFVQGEDVPPEAIVGAWRVNAEGTIVGEFLKNARYDPIRWPAGPEP